MTSELREPITSGFGGGPGVIKGPVKVWDDSLLFAPERLEGQIIYSQGETPLHRAAVLADAGVRAVLMEQGGANYHPHLLLKDAQVPAVAGVGCIPLEGRTVTIDARSGRVYDDDVDVPSDPAGAAEEGPSGNGNEPVYVNVGSKVAVELGAEAGADGIGLLRTEFTAARTLARLMRDQKVDLLGVEELEGRWTEADLIYDLAKRSPFDDLFARDLQDIIGLALRAFAGKDVFVRTLDVARSSSDALGNRGIRRCVAEGGATITILGRAARAALRETEGPAQLGVLLPLVSHYSQVKAAVDHLLECGLELRTPTGAHEAAISFGWEVEQPAAALCNEVWLEAFRADYGTWPHIVGIGTNDLTQFTLALGRETASGESDSDARAYLRALYDETDLSVVVQLRDIAKACARVGTRVFLLGEAGGREDLAGLLMALGITPSVRGSDVGRVKSLLSRLRMQDASDLVGRYIARVADTYSSRARDQVTRLLERLLRDEQR